MVFKTFSDLAKDELRSRAVGSADVTIKSELDLKRRPKTVIRFSTLLTERVGLAPGRDRVELFIDDSDRTMKCCGSARGRYKLLGARSGRPYIKFTVAKGMPVSEQTVNVDG